MRVYFCRMGKNKKRGQCHVCYMQPRNDTDQDKDSISVTKQSFVGRTHQQPFGQRYLQQLQQCDKPPTL